MPTAVHVCDSCGLRHPSAATQCPFCGTLTPSWYATHPRRGRHPGARAWPWIAAMLLATGALTPLVASGVGGTVGAGLGLIGGLGLILYALQRFTGSRT